MAARFCCHIFFLDNDINICYKYIVSVEATWTHSGPGGSTQRLHHNNTGSFVIVHKTKQGASRGVT